MRTFLSSLIVAVGCGAVHAQDKPAVARWEGVKLSDHAAKVIGDRIWESECSHTRDGLTSWNKGEAFASLGIGHFIWYPRDKDAIYEESFPPLIAFLSENEIKIPTWLKSTTDCPWTTRDEFMNDFRSERMNSLRDLLADTISLQTAFITERFNQSFLKLLDQAGEDRAEIEAQFRALAHTPVGIYAMMDYVNFKGEGTNPKERYNGEGWGLLQVLKNMKSGKAGRDAVIEFSESADRTLTRRVANHPVDQRWLEGWRNRTKGYQREFPAAPNQ